MIQSWKVYFAVVFAVVTLIFAAGSALAGMPYTFTNGTVANADQVNSNFQYVDPGKMWKTGQTNCYDASGSVITCTGTGQDGELQKGTAFTRFTDNSNGTVTDNLTGLIWLKNANCFGTRTWTQALSDANGLASGTCSLTDSSTAGQWRLPNIAELESLVLRQFPGSLIVNDSHPFTNLQTGYYWSSSTLMSIKGDAAYVHMSVGSVGYYSKTNSDGVWPVRGGQ